VSVFIVESPPGPLYLLGNIQRRKSKEKFKVSLAPGQAGLEVYLFKEHAEGKK
jgi:hypothetical protein